MPQKYTAPNMELRSAREIKIDESLSEYFAADAGLQDNNRLDEAYTLFRSREAALQKLRELAAARALEIKRHVCECVCCHCQHGRHENCYDVALSYRPVTPAMHTCHCPECHPDRVAK